MADKLKALIVGVDNMGRTRRNIMHECEHFEIIGGYDYNKQFLAAFEKEEGCSGVNSYEDLLAIPGAEVMVICTGAKFHAAQIIVALRAGLHVFVEKPLCSTPKELETIMNVQAETGLCVHVGHEAYETDPLSRYIKEQIDSGAIGKPVCFEMTTAHSGGLMIKPGDWRGDPETNPGGMLFQCGVHSFYELLYHHGPLKKVMGLMRYDVHTTQTADAAICSMEFEGGIIGTLHAYHVTPYRHTYSVFGTKKNIYRSTYGFGDKDTLFEQARLENAREDLVSIAIDGERDRVASMRQFYEAVRGNKPEKTNLVRAACAVNAVFAAEHSSKMGREVYLSGWRM